MKSQQVEYQRRKYRYLLSILDVFSQYHWENTSLTSKHASKVVIKFKKIYEVHGTPENPQRDRGKKFYGAVKTFCKRKIIKMTKSWAYLPQSVGKVKRSHRRLRKKINYHLVKQDRKVVDWVKSFLEYLKCRKKLKRTGEMWWSC